MQAQCKLLEELRRGGHKGVQCTQHDRVPGVDEAMVMVVVVRESSSAFWRMLYLNSRHTERRRLRCVAAIEATDNMRLSRE